MTYDVRSVANLVISTSQEGELPVTNLSLNKIIYFLHGWYLAKYGIPLTEAKIEAWQYGPVFREVYSQFKEFGQHPIERKATKIDPNTGKSIECVEKFPDDERKYLTKLAKKYLCMSAFSLVSLSHERGGPWDTVWNHRGATHAGMRISDELISSYFDKKLRH